jgi:hypothetical protein
MAFSVVVGLLALAMPTPESVTFEESRPLRSEPTIEKKGGPRPQRQPKGPERAQAPKAPKPDPVVPQKTTVSGRITPPS